MRAQVKEDVLVAGLCRLDEQLRCFTLPPPEEVAGLRVLVCTCCAAGLLTQGEYGAWRTAARQRLMFTHVMIDEAGQVSGLSAECAGMCGWMSCCKAAQSCPPCTPAALSARSTAHEHASCHRLFCRRR